MSTQPIEPIDPVVPCPSGDAYCGTIDVPEPFLGRCFDGTSEYGFVPCSSDESGNAIPLYPPREAVTVEQSAPPISPVSELPETGAASGGFVLVGLILCVAGLTCRKVSKPCGRS